LPPECLANDQFLSPTRHRGCANPSLAKVAIAIVELGAVDFDAVVLADSPRAHVRVAGLSARERAIRVARLAGAARVHAVDDAAMRAALIAWFAATSGRALLVIRADQLVHTGLVRPLLPALAHASNAIAVVPTQPAADDLAPGSYAGALVVRAARATAVIEALARGDSDEAIAGSLADAERIEHGEVARAPLATQEQQRKAQRVLYRTLVKPQDNAITRYLYRPVSFPLTHALAWTPITPNQISYAVAALVALGCYLVAGAGDHAVLTGTLVILAASYLDCCDGEIARIKLLQSRLGAWIDTIVDELSSFGYMVAVGVHCAHEFGPHAFGELPLDPWHAGIALGVVVYAITMYCIYYNLIVAVGSANSQDYVGRFEVVPGERPNGVKLRPLAAQAIPLARQLPQPLRWIATYAPYIVRRDFIAWATVGMAAAGIPQVIFACLLLGGTVTAAIVAIDHVKLRSLRRSIERRGLVLEAP
jgi:hypothetical protein